VQLDNLVVRDIMTPTVVHVTEDLCLRQAADLMRQHGVRRLLVTQGRTGIMRLVNRTLAIQDKEAKRMKESDVKPVGVHP
jgi:CBS domain-containing protein